MQPKHVCSIPRAFDYSAESLSLAVVTWSHSVLLLYDKFQDLLNMDAQADSVQLYCGAIKIERRSNASLHLTSK